MKALLEPIKEIARFDELFRDLKKGIAGVTVISGCLESQKAHMIAGLSEDAPVRLLIAENELKAKELYEDYRLYDAETLYYPAKDLYFLSGRHSRKSADPSAASGDPGTS